jgi:O-methyltransferase domain
VATNEVTGASLITATGTGEVVVPALQTAYDFGHFRTSLDVGGGDGGLLAAVLAAHPDLHGVLLDYLSFAASRTRMMVWRV